MRMTSTPLAGPAAAPAQGEPYVPKRRNTEALLLLFALGIGLFAYADVGDAATGRIPANLPALAAEFGIALLAAHLVVRRFAPYADPVILPVAAMINGLGLAMIYRLDPYNIANKLAPKGGAAPNQAVYTVLGLMALILIVIFLRDHRVLQRYAYISALVGLSIIALPAVLPASISEVNGARSWIRLGGFSVQPAEFGKLLMVSFFAAYLHAKRDALALASRKVLGLYLPRGRDMGPILVVWAFAMLILIRETDLGVSLMFFGAFVIMLYMATERTSWLLFGVLLFVGGAWAVAQMSSHVMVRVNAWLHPFSDVTGQTRQLAQSLYAFANGGLLGTGLGHGYSYQIGFANNADFMLATVGEELGLFGLTALFIAYAIIVMRSVKTAMLVRDPYGKLFAAGLAATFALQVFITAGGVLRVIPLTGLPMPFLAYGGSALMANWILVALVIKISDAARRPLPPAIPLTDEMAQVVKA